jgi:hypothetical protein
LLFYLTIWLSGCSLFFGKTISEEDLNKNHTLRIYKTGLDLTLLAKELNDKGEAVVIGRFDEIQVYLQIFAKREGLIVNVYDIYDYNFGKFDIYEED